MNWDAIGAIGELTAALGVIASLIYLSIQIRQNTASLRAENLREVVNTITATLDRITSNPKDVAVYLRGHESLKSLSPEERERFFVLVASLLANCEFVKQLHHDGLVKDGTFQAALRLLEREFSNPGVREIWEERRLWFADDFRAFIDSKFFR